ncbi:MAG TPA: transposase [Kofleriaceae bacterium]|nr:transposase [Kofleriaceae bacterium]
MVSREPGRDHAGVRRRYTAKQRRELIDLVTTGRLSISEAAAQLGIPLSTASYWVRKAGKKLQKPPKATQARKPAKPPSADPSTFVQLIRAKDTGAVIEVRLGRTRIQVRHGFDAQLLRAVIELLQEIVG